MAAEVVVDEVARDVTLGVLARHERGAPRLGGRQRRARRRPQREDVANLVAAPGGRRVAGGDVESVVVVVKRGKPDANGGIAGVW